jgi:hypothetical protein
MRFYNLNPKMAIEFKLVKDPDTTVYENMRVASQAYAVGDSVMLDRTADAIEVVPATAATVTTNIYGVAMEAVTSSATSLLIARVTNRQLWSADTTGTATAADNEQRMLLTDKGTVNNSHTDSGSPSAVFQQTGYISANRIVGRFLTSAISA